MSYHPRIESADKASLATTRSRNSELWFINNRRLEHAILGYVAKFAKRYKVELYGFSIEGNHLHSVAGYPGENRAHFQRDLNSCVARAIPRYVREYAGGRFWARRYSSEFIAEYEDIENYFFYLVLQPVQDGLVDRISDYPGYNCFSDAINGIKQRFQVVNWAQYNECKRWRSDVKIKDFTEIVELSYKRLPGYEHLSKCEYRAIMLKKLEERRLAILAKRNKPSLGSTVLRGMKPGSRPQHTKSGTRFSHRPRILCADPHKRAEHKAWYFSVHFAYKECSRRFRNGELTIQFPQGTYRPPLYAYIAKPQGP